MSPELEVADLGLLTRFGNGVSALSPFDGMRERVEAPAPASRGPRLLGELFVAQGLLTDEQLRWALREQAESGRLLGEIVVQHDLVSMVALVNALVEQLRVEPAR